MSQPGTANSFSPLTAEVRLLDPEQTGARIPHECLPPRASLASTVRPRTNFWGSVVYFAMIGDHVYDWSPLQGAWVRPC